jgi:hypothetical protein
MALHLLKLSVGTESVRELEDWVKLVLKSRNSRGEKAEQFHTTRMIPKRSAELLDGGSLYWVIKGQIAARQALVELRPLSVKGVAHCGLVHHKDLIPVRPRPRAAFQGWRYLEAADAPPDLARLTGDVKLPEALRRELAALGLL